MKYKVDCIKNYNEQDYKKIYSQIRKEKQNKIDKYIKEESKKRSMLGEYLLQKLLKEERIDYNKIQIKTNKNEKPYIENKKIYYNISHSYDYVITAISEKPIGVDIEKIRKIDSKTINMFATSKEKEYILSEKKGLEKRLFEIYTLKEAYIKMKGLALKDIKKTEFAIENQLITNSDQKTQSKLIHNVPEYIIAICEQK